MTVTFRPDEKDQIQHLLRSKAGQFKTISFLPLTDNGVTYAQAPFEPITHDQAAEIRSSLKKVNLKAVYDGGKAADATDSKFCDTDACEITFNNVVE